MSETFSKGNKVRWKSHGAEARGKVVRKQSGATRIKGHKVAASPEEPQFIVETDQRKRAAHRPEALTRD